MMRKVSLVFAGAVLGAGLTGMVTQTRLLTSTSAVAASAEVYRSLNLFGDIFEKIRTDYVEKPDEQKLIEAAINGMVSSLDPHSSYLDAKSFRDMDTDMRGQFGGLGIEVTMEEGVLKVAKPIRDTPAFKAGILAKRHHQPDRRPGGERPLPDPGGREDARHHQHPGQAQGRAPRQAGAAGIHADAHDHRRSRRRGARRRRCRITDCP